MSKYSLGRAEIASGAPLCPFCMMRAIIHPKRDLGRATHDVHYMRGTFPCYTFLCDEHLAMIPAAALRYARPLVRAPQDQAEGKR